MELTFECPACGVNAQARSVEHHPEVTCPSCRDSRPLREGFLESGELRACGLCGSEDLYLQKDFPQGMGLLIVVVGFAISTVFWYYRMALAAYGVLLASALLDLVLYYKVPDVTICYRCLSQYRGAGAQPAGRFLPFDLAIGERYRQERIRVEELRSRRSGKPSSPLPHE